MKTLIICCLIFLACDSTKIVEPKKMTPMVSVVYADLQDRIDSLEVELCITKKLLNQHKRIWKCYREWFECNGFDAPCFGRPINIVECEE